MTDRYADEIDVVPATDRRRRWARALGVVGAIGLGYWLSPYAASARLALAVQSGQDAAVLSRIDLAGLRNGFARQIVRAYMAKNPQTRELGPLERQLAGGVAAGYVSGIIGEYLTPETIAELLRRGRLPAQRDGMTGEQAGLPRLDGFGQAWRLFRASGFADPTRFVVDPPSVDAADRYRLVFGLKDAAWRLREVELPPSVIDRFVGDLAGRITRGS